MLPGMKHRIVRPYRPASATPQLYLTTSQTMLPISPKNRLTVVARKKTLDGSHDAASAGQTRGRDVGSTFGVWTETGAPS